EFNVQKQIYWKATLITGSTLPDSFGLSSQDFGTERILFGKPSGQSNFGVQIIGGQAFVSTVPIRTNTAYTLVARLDFDDNLIRLYINPDLSGSEPTNATVSAAYPDTFWSTAVRLGSGLGGAVSWDNLAVGTSWDDLRTVVTTAVDEDNGFIGGGTG